MKGEVLHCAWGTAWPKPRLFTSPFMGEVGRGPSLSVRNWRADAYSDSRNRIGCPTLGVTSSPCHITVLPRTMVPTGQPVTLTPS